MKKLLSLFFASILITSFATPITVNATSVNTTVNGSILATVLNVSVPSSLAFSIDPNNAENTAIISDATIINNTNAPINVFVGAGSINFQQSETSEWKPIDYLPSEKDWSNLGKISSENSLALGVKLKNKSEWRSVQRTNTLWVKEHSSSVDNVVFGELNSLSSAVMTLDVFHGNAFSEPKTCSYSIVWSFSLAD